jgi:transposase
MPSGIGAKTRTKASRNIGALPQASAASRAGDRAGDDGVPLLRGAAPQDGEDVNEVRDVIPALLRVLRTIRRKYACRRCTDGVVQAKAEPRLIESGHGIDGVAW